MGPNSAKTHGSALYESRVIAFACMAFAVWAVYGGAFGHRFLFDDMVWIVRDPFIRTPLNSVLYTSRPITGFTLWVNYWLDGINPPSFRLFNFIVHAINAWLVFVTLGELLKADGRLSAPLRAIVCWGTALLFAVHPVQTAAVTYVIQRAELLSALFSLLCIWSFLIFVRTANSRHGTVSVVACALGMAAKATAIVLPIVVYVLYRAANGLRRRDEAARMRPFFGLLALTWLAPLAILSAPHESRDTTGWGGGVLSVPLYAMSQPRIVLHYLRLAFAPIGQCFDYGWLPERSLAGALPAIFGVGLLLAAAVRGLYLGRRWTLGILWFFLWLAPSSSLYPVMDYAVEHRMYLALAGPLFLLALGAMRLASGPQGQPSGRRFVYALAPLCLVLLAFGFLARVRNRAFASPDIMADDVLRRVPNNYRWLVVKSQEYRRAGRLEEAVDVAERLIETAREERKLVEATGEPRPRARDPVYFESMALQEMALTQWALGRPEEAMTWIAQAERAATAETLAHVLYTKAALSFALGDVAGARRGIGDVLRQRPQHSAALALGGLLAAHDGEWAKSKGLFWRSLSYAPDRLWVRLELAWLLACAPDDAVRDGAAALAFALSVKRVLPAPTAGTLDVLAAALAESGRFEEAALAANDALALLEHAELTIEETAPASMRNESRESIAQRLAGYRERRPYRMAKPALQN